MGFYIDFINAMRDNLIMKQSKKIKILELLEELHEEILLDLEDKKLTIVQISYLEGQARGIEQTINVIKLVDAF